MAQVIRSGAFLQQCWSVHPLCLTVKRIEEGRDVILTCSSCRMVHHATFQAITVEASAGGDGSSLPPSAKQAEGAASLVTCLGAHAQALSLRAMDVFEDALVIRCAECRSHFHVNVSRFETHQR
jgi:hypothetical protein